MIIFNHLWSVTASNDTVSTYDCFFEELDKDIDLQEIKVVIKKFKKR